MRMILRIILINMIVVSSLFGQNIIKNSEKEIVPIRGVVLDVLSSGNLICEYAYKPSSKELICLNFGVDDKKGYNQYKFYNEHRENFSLNPIIIKAFPAGYYFYKGKKIKKFHVATEEEIEAKSSKEQEKEKLKIINKYL